MSNVRWVANVKKQQPVADDVQVDTLHKDGHIYINAPAGAWSAPPDDCGNNDWWVRATNSENTIIGWQYTGANVYD